MKNITGLDIRREAAMLIKDMFCIWGQRVW